jgi:hypothetical protein
VTKTLSGLDEIRETFGLSKTELATLFGRQAPSVAEWAKRGIPFDRRATAERLVDLAALFRRELVPSRIPEIVRTPDAWLGGKTILQVLATDGVDPIYAYLKRLFSYDG